jgi:hypothetical protein
MTAAEVLDAANDVDPDVTAVRAGLSDGDLWKVPATREQVLPILQQ